MPLSSSTHADRKQYPRLDLLASTIARDGKDGFEECSELPGQSREVSQRYLQILGRGVHLFRKEELINSSKRIKFLEKIRSAAQHMTQRCSCTKRAARPNGSREMRLSLLRHRELAPKIKGHIVSSRSNVPANFEVLLLDCKDETRWRVTDIEVINSFSQNTTNIRRELVNRNVCNYLRESDGTLEVDFQVQNDKLWHLDPKLLETIGQYTAMEPLERFLGDTKDASYMSRCNPKDQLILCYILATSMLYLYPSSWLHTVWDSHMIYFTRQSSTWTSPDLTFPYVSTEVQKPKTSKNPPDRMQAHTHPAILNLGIIFLEISTGSRFQRTREPTPREQCNRDNQHALDLLKDLARKDRRHRAKHISPALRKAIRACLKLEPPSDFPSNQLAKEEPIRQYILYAFMTSTKMMGWKVSAEDRQSARTWFDSHNDALARISELRNPAVNRVKIAILDSGILLSQENEDLYNQEPNEVGHGTHLAVLLRKMAPNAIVHVGRVFRKKPNRKSTKTIAQAIRHAVDEWNVDMIVMSFGFGEEHQDMQGAIRYAAFREVLMFAAASNDGKNRPDGVAWPARDMNVICVHSADGHGTPSTFTPGAQDNMRIKVLGESVKFLSGTSCAAPIAAGIAALILDYARAFLDEQEWRQLRRTDTIRRVFASMNSRSRSEYWWINHWRWFDSKCSEGWIQGEISRLL
ncbi:subtilisin-like protein [Bimuria novae-zelandiae CBS 107.79]|uniref:Subtilisin-like protein n=1 Tax=Bimuria novae-zelandiae CBS 107.79 TaxID=1447943 RepID=A0A6A5UUA3_9PLEO|nr:subtilisin-like protein [Bimuria novae-zelandiae CBS 107.79]